MKRHILFFIIAGLILPLPPVFCQEAETDFAGSPVYTDVIFNEYIDLETDILGKQSEGTLEGFDLGRIESLKNKAATANRRDILSRLEMLNFIVKSGLEEQELNADTEAFIKSVAGQERKLRAEAAASRTSQTLAAVSIGTAIVSGSVFAASALVSSEYYRKYTETEYADQAAFYLFWWQFLDTVSFVSAITALVTTATAGIMAASY